MMALYEKVLVNVRIAESAQPRKASNVTRPFPVLWVGSGDETTYILDISLAKCLEQLT